MRTLVTGGAGFIGSHVVDALIERGHAVAVIDDLSSGQRKFVSADAEFHECDIRGGRCGKIIRDFRPEIIFHLAAQKSVRDSVNDPLHDADVNVLGTIRLLQAAQKSGTRHIVFSSTGGALYGDTDRLPTPEVAPCHPASPYGTSKFCAEHYLDCFHALYGLNYTILRYANVYGPRQDPYGEAGVVAIFVQKMLLGDPPMVNGDGKQTRDYVYVADVVEANMRAMEQKGNGIYNIGTGVETSVNSIVQMVKTKTSSEVSEVHGPAKNGEQRRSAVDISRAKSELHWEPKYTLEQGIRETVEWFKQSSQLAIDR